jgi:hypothetical protein
MKGKPIQISAVDLRKTTHKLKVHPHHVKQIISGRRLNNGSGIIDWLKAGTKRVKKNVINTDKYEK